MTHIMLIEDNLDEQEIFLSALSGIGGLIACETFTTAEAALEDLRSGKNKPDIIFLSMTRTGQTGFTFLNAFRKDNDLKGLPIVVITDSSDALDLEMARLAGTKRIVRRPVSIHELATAIARSLEMFAY